MIKSKKKKIEEIQYEIDKRLLGIDRLNEIVDDSKSAIAENMKIIKRKKERIKKLKAE